MVAIRANVQRRRRTACRRAPPADTLPPELVDHADWEIVRELGRGGMGVVYLAKNRLMGRMEVLKVVGRHLIERPGVFERFRREIQSAARLQHTNIVTAYTAVRLGSSLVFAMEYVDGLDLARIAKTKGPLPISHAAYFTHQVALGLQHAHERGMVHRDIKPANLILARDGKKSIVKVLDFGLAKVTSEGESDSNLTREGQMVGTPDYIAPEQIRDAKSADIRADIYSLGCTLYYLLTGSPPFRREHLFDVYKAHESTVATPLNLVRPEVPVELAAVAAKMMAKEPARRFQTPAQVAQALVPFFKTTGSTAQGPAKEIAQTGQPTWQSMQVEAPTAPAQPGAVESSAATPVAQGSQRSQPAEPKWESLIEFKETEPLTEIAPRPMAIPNVPRRAQMGLAAAAAVLLLGLLGTWVAFNNWAETPKGDDADNSSLTPPKRRPATDLVIDGVPRDSKPNEEGSSPVIDRSKFTIISGKWRVEGEDLDQTDSDPSSGELLFGDAAWTDYDFSVTAKLVSTGDRFSLLFRSPDPVNAYDFAMADNPFEVAVAGNGSKTCDLYARAPSRLRTLKSYDLRLRNGAWYVANVTVRGNRLTGSLYDTHSGTETGVFDILDDRHSRGRVGLQAAGSSVRFKHIKVTAPDGKVLWEGLPAVAATTASESSKEISEFSRTGIESREPRFRRAVSLFDDRGLHGLREGDGNKGSWDIASGVLFLRGAAPNGGGPGALVTSRRDYSDFRLRVRTRNIDGKGKHVILRRAETDLINGYAVWVCAQTVATGEAVPVGSIGKCVDRPGRTRPPLDVQAASVPVPMGEWYTLEITAIGNRITTAVNETKVAEYIDESNSFKSGCIPFSCQSASLVEFRELAIQELER
jgi:serine/threonine protein kinase